MEIKQQTRMMAITTPLGEDVLVLRSFSGTEAISRLFEIDLELLSDNDSIEFSQIIGKSVTLRIGRADDAQAYWNGYISEFRQQKRLATLTAYQARVVPWLWFLTLRTNSRIFQNQTTPQIIDTVFTSLGFHDFTWRLESDYQPREYCVQYQETDFTFVSRLMEEEGIFYFFEHQDGRHTLTMADQTSGIQECPGQATANYSRVSGGIRSADAISDWNVRESFVAACVALNDYNFKTPSLNMEISVQGDNPFEIYGYPGGYSRRSQGEFLANLRFEELRGSTRIATGSTDCRFFRAGYRFTLNDHYRPDFNQPYILAEIHHFGVEGGYQFEPGVPQDEPSSYSNAVICVPASAPLRPVPQTARRLIQGCQTATVVGPAGEEIYTDEFGRVKVQFHWDRYGNRDEKSSCWIRVAQSWAGMGWGAMTIPRIGQEVVVEFLEGNPDRPLITGCVYNGQMAPPYGLPANKDMTGIKSSSTKGGGGYNEIVLKDAKGNELVRIHGQRDMETTVENDDKQYVVGDRSIDVGGTHQESVKGDIHVQSTAGLVHIEASTKLSLKVGESHLFMDDKGFIMLKGKHVIIVGSDMVDINPD